jgi:hypothetical protein
LYLFEKYSPTISSNTLLTKNLLNDYKHFSNIKYFWTQPKGIYNAMNIGLKMSTENSCIWFLNPGDILLSVECVSQVLEKFDKLEIDYCITQSVYANRPYAEENFFPHLKPFPPRAGPPLQFMV